MIACYVRVSTTGQNTAGQRAEIGRYLEGHGLNGGKVQWFEDKATGANLDRPAFEEMERRIFLGEVKQVIVYRLDRLSRSIRDGINLLCDWLERGVKVVAIANGLEFGGGAQGRMLASLFLGVAEMEREAIRERQAAGIALAKERGAYTGRKSGTTKAKPMRAKELQAQGLTSAEIATALGTSQRTVFRYLKA